VSVGVGSQSINNAYKLKNFKTIKKNVKGSRDARSQANRYILRSEKINYFIQKHEKLLNLNLYNGIKINKNWNRSRDIRS